MNLKIDTDNQALYEFAEAAVRAMGENLVALIEYQRLSVVEPGARPKLNVLLLCREVGPAVTTSLRDPLARACKKVELALVVFSKDEFLASLDVFPVEASEIRRSYKVIVGEDVVRQAEVTMRHLRHQLEFELRSKKLFLLSQLLKYDEESREVGETILAFHEAFMNLAQYYASLKGNEVVSSRASLVRELSGDPGIPSEVLERLGEVAAGRVRVGPGEKSRLVWTFIEAVDRLTLAIDQLETK